MKAAVLHTSGLSIETDVTPPPLKAGQVLVKLAYSGICHSQLMEVRGLRGEDKYCPHLLGHEGAGIVQAVGAGVKKVAPGERVVLTWLQGEGHNAGGSEYALGEVTVNAGPVTTLSEYSVVSENRCLVLPEGIPLDIAVLFGCAIPTGMGIVCNEVKPKPGSQVAVFGLGGIGLSALMACRLFDYKTLIAVDVEDKKLSLAQDFGATHTINASTTDPVEAILEITQGIGVDYSIEAAGVVKSIEQAFYSVRNQGGLCVFATHPKAGDKIQLDPHALISGKQIRGSWGGASHPEKDLPRLFDLYKNGKLPIEKLLSHTYSLDNVPQAFDDLEARKITRALVAIDPTL